LLNLTKINLKNKNNKIEKDLESLRICSCNKEGDIKAAISLKMFKMN
jgi:hypothetical protein